MSCCKKQIRKPDGSLKEDKPKGKFTESFVARVLVFLLILALSPIILLALWVIIFKYYFITGKIDLKENFKKINKKMEKSQPEEEEDDDPENYEYHNIYTVEKIK